MASLHYGQSFLEMLNGGATNPLDPLNDTKVKIELLNNTYSPVYEDEVADAGGASDVIDAILNATGYSGGYGGADRQSLTTRALARDDTNNRLEYDADDVTWSSIGNGTNDTAVGAVILKEDHLGTTGNDTETRLIWYIDIADTTTNGGDITISWDAEGIVQYA